MAVEYRKIALYNQGSESGALWIDSAIGYVLGARDAIDQIGRLDLGWPELYGYTCENCGTGLSEDEYLYGADEYIYCERCYYRLFDSCSWCGETYWQEDITAVDNDYLCRDCLENRYAVCDGCGEFVRNDKVHHDEENDKTYCETCAERE